MAKKQIWEYCSRYSTGHEMKGKDVVPFLNEMGANGWELVSMVEEKFMNDPVSVAYRTFYFKRIKHQTPHSHEQ